MIIRCTETSNCHDTTFSILSSNFTFYGFTAMIWCKDLCLIQSKDSKKCLPLKITEVLQAYHHYTYQITSSFWFKPLALIICRGLNWHHFYQANPYYSVGANNIPLHIFMHTVIILAEVQYLTDVHAHVVTNRSHQLRSKVMPKRLIKYIPCHVLLCAYRWYGS